MMSQAVKSLPLVFCLFPVNQGCMSKLVTAVVCLDFVLALLFWSGIILLCGRWGESRRAWLGEKPNGEYGHMTWGWRGSGSHQDTTEEIYPMRLDGRKDIWSVKSAWSVCQYVLRALRRPSYPLWRGVTKDVKPTHAKWSWSINGQSGNL